MLEIFSFFVASGDAKDDGRRVSQLMWFTDNFPASEFQREDLILYNYVQFSSVLRVPLSTDYFEVFCESELRKILLKTKVKIDGTDDLNYDDPSVFEVAADTIKQYIGGYINRWSNDPKNPVDFIVAAKSFLHLQLNSRFTQALSNSFEMSVDTEDTGKALNYAQSQMEMLQEIYDESKLEELDVSIQRQGETQLEFICDTGLPSVDSDIDGIYSTQLGGVEAAPGTGKTRFGLGVWAYRAAVLYHKNVIFYTLEQSKGECEAMLVARHVYEMFELQIEDKLIYKNKVPDEYKEQVRAARIDLFESGKYGKIDIEETDLYMETFIDKIKSADRLKGPFDLIIIDYMALITEKNTYGRPKNIGEVVSYCYRSFKKYCRKNNKAGIAVNQLNREGIAASKADKEITTEMGQGGIEVYRSTDFNLTISATQEMELQHKRRISQPKKRSSKGIGSVVVDVRLGVCLFYQQVEHQI